MEMEIERKFLISNINFDLNNYSYDIITQGYISTSPVIRIRQKNNEYYLTCKSKGMLARKEFEIKIKKNEFLNLFKKVDNHLIIKKRYYIPLNHLIIELDVFEKQLKGLIIAEVEFSSIEEANSFTPPDWFGNDVTKDKKYHNSYLSQITSYEAL